jgi:2,3-bisphosphoglycerate-dependent phosphoglycerate mutase
MSKLILLRHGTSQWNLENRFTGWTDVDLAPSGVDETHHAAELMKKAGIVPEVTFSSVLKRAIRTLWIVLEDMDLCWLPQELSWRLNERHYGALQGLNKAETAAKYGEQMVHEWRRSYRTRPPLLDPSDERAPFKQPQYRGIDPALLPLGESLYDCEQRVLPFWNHSILPQIRQGKTVLVALSGNSGRAMVKRIDKISDQSIADLNIPTGQPLVYEFDENGCAVKHYYLATDEEIAAGIENVKMQGQAR